MPNPRVFLDCRIGNDRLGRMEFELFADTVPRTAENFRCFCTGEKGVSKTSGKPLHFRNTIFHRIIKGFMAQGGDFDKADGTGGESIYSKTFADESFARKHIGPGMLSMANCGKNTNGSQFFITFKSTPHLNGKHVCFGRLVTGMATLQKLERTPCNTRDRPQTDVTIFNCGEVGKAPAANIVAALKAKGVGDFEKAVEKKVEKKVEVEEDAEPQKPANYEGMSAREKKLFDLKLKLNRARKDNKREALEEHKRYNSKTNPNSKRKQFLERKEAWEKEMKERGDEEEPWMHETAESVGYREKRKSKKKAASYGWEVFNQDAGYNAMKKRLAEARQNEDTETRDINNLDYFEAHKPSDANIDRMVNELAKTQERRSKFSRRRAHHEDADIDSINERNAVYNKKVKRAYDKYTAEIKANFERGTAL